MVWHMIRANILLIVLTDRIRMSLMSLLIVLTDRIRMSLNTLTKK